MTLRNDRVINALREAAGSIIMPRFRKLATGDVRSKGGVGNLVTVADEECEALLSRILTDILPGSLVVGEETVAKSPGVLSHLASDDWVWVIDPIDGTANFVNGESLFCSMLALVHRGVTAAAWIYRPVDGTTMTAERGAGVSLIEYNDKARPVYIPSLESEELNTMVAALYNKDLAPLKGKFLRVSRRGCAGLDYWDAVEGHIQVISFRRLMPWDHAPGDLIYREAGGAVRLLSGMPYVPSEAEQIGILAAPTEEVWQKIAAMAPKSDA